MKEKNTPPSVDNTTISLNATASYNDAETADNTNLGLILKTIQLTQGEKGAELWRLNAQAASITKQEGLILIENPKLIYILPPDNKELHVTSIKGDIEQDQQILRFMKNVHATHETKVMTGELLVYNGTAKAMVFPHGGVFSDEDIYGMADIIVWNLTTRHIEAQGNVNITFSAPKNIATMKKNNNDTMDTFEKNTETSNNIP